VVTWLVLYNEEVYGIIEIKYCIYNYEQLLDAKGVRSHFKTTVSKFIGSDGKLTHIVLQDGTELSADLCIVGIGKQPSSVILMIFMHLCVRQ